jgi:hypothetical protein
MNTKNNSFTILLDETKTNNILLKAEAHLMEHMASMIEGCQGNAFSIANNHVDSLSPLR